MADVQARALYDFQGDTSIGELSFYTGEVLTILRQDIGDGWFEAANGRGEQGLVPETYVEVTSFPEPSFPPPPAPVAPSAPPMTLKIQNGPTSYQDPGGGKKMNTQDSVDDWDDEWDDDQSSNSTTQENHNSGQHIPPTRMRAREQKISPTGTGDMSKYGTVRKNFNRFSTFAKTGGEAFMMGTVQGNVSESDLIKMIETVDGPEWTTLSSQYSCAVGFPKKESKMKGLKSFIVYHLTPSISNIQVCRRYKHFDWLHQQLEDKFTCIPIPPLPDKAISGRYEEDFIQERMLRLQLWVNRMVRHPVISKSDVFIHFLTCTDDKKWKQGKRKAEKDEYTGAKFFLTLQTPPNPLDMTHVDSKMETFCKFVRGMDENLKQLIVVHHTNMKKHQGPFKKEYQGIGMAYKLLATTFALDTAKYSVGLTNAINHTGDTYNEIGHLFEHQPKSDTAPLLDILNEYKGHLGVYPEVLKVHEGAMGKAKECKKQQEEGKISESEVQGVLQRADVISYGSMAEMNHFQHERVKDFKAAMQDYLQAQIDFYKEITKKLEVNLEMYKSA